MSLLQKVLPHALCCFLNSRDIEDDETRPSTVQDVPPIVARKPIPYSMINVPQQPDFEDEQAFRRMLNASPACPVEAEPIDTGLRKDTKKRTRDILLRSSSSKTEITPARSGSAPQSARSGSKHPARKLSRPPLTEKSSKGKSREFESQQVGEDCVERVDDNTAAALATAQATGMIDILTPRNASLAGYDDDAKIVKTPDMEDTLPAKSCTPDRRTEHTKGAKLTPTNPTSRLPLPSSEKTRDSLTPKRVKSSSPYLCSPGKISFIAALQPTDLESPVATLKRLSAGIVDGTIKPPTDLELQTLRGSISQPTSDDWESSLQAPLRWSGLNKDPGSSQTAIRRLSDMVQGQSTAILAEAGAGKDIDSKRSSVLSQLEPALLEYLSRISDMVSLDLAAHEDTATPATMVRREKSLTGYDVTEREELSSSDLWTSTQPQPDNASAVSFLPSGHNSVHLFNMNIPTRLENKSNATLFSPAVSANNSGRSLECPPPLPTIAKTSPVIHVPLCGLGRAEHTRKPSDPQTRNIFEQPDRRYYPYWKSSSTSLAQSKTFCERDDVSSIYSSEYRISGRSNSPRLPAIGLPRQNINSLAVGGRSASTEIPARRSSRTQGLQPRVLERSFSAGKVNLDRLDAASEVISKYLDGKVEDCSRPTSLEHVARAGDDGNQAVAEQVGDDFAFVTKAHQSSPVSRPRSKDDSNTSVNELTNEEGGTIAQPSSLKEAATDLWNRAYREARADSQTEDLLSASNFSDYELHLSPSRAAIPFPYRSQSSSILHTPKSALRRSQSVGPNSRTSFREDMPTGSGAGTNLLARTMRRLSFWSLKSQQQPEALDHTPAETARSNGEELTKKRSTTMFDIDRARKLRAAHTPPLSHYLGLWGSFPSQGREQRNGAAGVEDNVLTRNFGTEQAELSTATLPPRLSTNTLSMMQNTTKRMFPARAKRKDDKEARGMSPGSPSHRVGKGQSLLLKRLQRQCRSKSSEWRGYVTANGHRSSISPGLPTEYPELEQFQGEGDSDTSRRQASPLYNVHNSSETVISTAESCKGTDSPAKVASGARRAYVQHAAKNKSSTWESITFTSMSDEDVPLKENVDTVEVLRGEATPPLSQLTAEADFGDARMSKDLKMPGSFMDY